LILASTKEEVYAAFLFRECLRHITDRQTYGMQRLIRPLGWAA